MRLTDEDGSKMECIVLCGKLGDATTSAVYCSFILRAWRQAHALLSSQFVRVPKLRNDWFISCLHYLVARRPIEEHIPDFLWLEPEESTTATNGTLSGPFAHISVGNSQTYTYMSSISPSLNSINLYVTLLQVCINTRASNILNIMKLCEIPQPTVCLHFTLNNFLMKKIHSSFV